MNFDGKALVVNQNSNVFYSSNDFAIVIPVKHITEFNQSIDMSDVVAEDSVANKKIFSSASSSSYSTVRNELTPYTTQVYDINLLRKKDINLIQTKICIFDIPLKYEKDCDFQKVKVTELLQPTNIPIKEVTAYIIDNTKSASSKEFSPIYATVTDKTEVIVPSVSSGYQEMSIVVQKNNFVELKFADTIIDATGIPEGMKYISGSIKGTITQSGSYDITIQYSDGSQKLNIVVPYYQRLL